MAYRIVLPGGSENSGKLVRFGYNTLTSKADNLLFPKGGTIRAHEFHYSDSTNNGADLRAEKKSRGWDCIHATETLFAGYPHLNLSVRPTEHAGAGFPVGFVEFDF